MENQPLLLKRFLPKKRRRRWRRDLIRFVDALGLSVQTGYDLAYAWPQVALALGNQWEPSFRAQMAVGSRSFSEFLSELAEVYPDDGHRLWIGILALNHSQGISLAQTLRAMGEALRREQSRAWEEHLRSLPLRVSIILAAFFVAPALGLVFVPLVRGMGAAF